MNNSQKLNFKDFSSVKPRTIKLSQEVLVKTSYLEGEEKFPLVVEPNVDNINLVAWVKSNQELIEAHLLQHGAILFRNFHLDSIIHFEQFTKVITPELLDYCERAAPRTEVGRNIYTSTEYPADQHIPLHHEMSYSHNWPTKLWFFCLQPAEQGGRTPIASARKVFQRIDPKIKQQFIEKKVMYVRNYSYGLDLPWQEVFQTNDKAIVEAHCRNAAIEFEWKDDNRLRTRQIRQAIATHPKTGETVWFNHAHMFHLSNLEPVIRESLLARFTEEELPRNAFYGDGSSIESSVLDEIREVYQQQVVTFPWQKGDILMLDNFLASHGREPFVGTRKIIVAMADLFINIERYSH